MDDITIDKDEIKSNEPKYLNEAIRIYKINRSLIVFVIIAIAIIKPMIKDVFPIFDILILIAFLGTLILAPLGIYYCYKSKAGNEEPSKFRFKYLRLNLLIAMVALAIVFMIIVQTAKLIYQT